MSNHAHIFLKEKEMGDIKKVMHKLLTTYVVWFNRKYQRSGSLIGNRYKSEPIEDKKYYFELVRYIHQNPVRAKMCNTPSEYRWSSYNDYVSGGKSITDTQLTLEMFSPEREEAIKRFEELHLAEDMIDFNITNTKKLTTAQIHRKIEKIIGLSPDAISKMPREERNQTLIKLRAAGLTIGQLERATGISRGIITKAK
jgi:hypothetical protein